MLENHKLTLDRISLAEALMTAVPESLRELLVTNFPSASHVIWEEFLDTNTPSWFTVLPTDIQTYLKQEAAAYML